MFFTQSLSISTFLGKSEPKIGFFTTTYSHATRNFDMFLKQFIYHVITYRFSTPQELSIVLYSYSFYDDMTHRLM